MVKYDGMVDINSFCDVTSEVSLVDASYIPRQLVQRAPLLYPYTNAILQYQLTISSHCKK
jgi:hypothetical protein